MNQPDFASKISDSRVSRLDSVYKMNYTGTFFDIHPETFYEFMIPSAPEDAKSKFVQEWK